jgi:hypothetical protein
MPSGCALILTSSISTTTSSSDCSGDACPHNGRQQTIRLPLGPSQAQCVPLSSEARQFFLTGEPEFADRYFPWLVNVMSPAYWVYLVMAVTAIFNVLKGLSRFWLWRIDAAREKLEAEIRRVAGDVVSHGPTRNFSTNELLLTRKRAPRLEIS